MPGTLVGDVNGDGYLDVAVGFGEALSIAEGRERTEGHHAAVRITRTCRWDGFGLLVAACE